ncbi:MAG: SDR family NAD(P)-dependent oxidoreductase, partial [Nitrospirota bacterium]|nr:SDR family NAD(P)-dependent oxidoreductase [Nitrospirota bacterium]
MRSSTKNCTVIISGASRGIGRAIAVELAKEGANISFNYLSSSREAAELEEEIRSYGAGAGSFQVDIKDYDAVKAWVEK